MTRPVLIRHGETDWNVEGRWQGLADVPLNSRGREQTAQIAQSLRNLGINAI
jgi:broad specificity phosphatase PhoE